MSSNINKQTIKENDQLKKENEQLKNNIETYKNFLNNNIDHNKKLRSQNEELRTIITKYKLQYDKLKCDKDVFLQLFIDEVDQRENLFQQYYDYKINPFEFYINSLNIENII